MFKYYFKLSLVSINTIFYLSSNYLFIYLIRFSKIKNKINIAMRGRKIYTWGKW